MKQDSWLADTRKVNTIGPTSICVVIKKEIREALGITKHSLVEIKIRNTGELVAPRKDKPKPDPIVVQV